MTIKFGTSGWRAIIAKTFTFERVRIVVQAIADYLKSKGHPVRPVLVGGDFRFLTEEFIRETAQVLAGNGIEVNICTPGIPTPVISHWIIKHKLAGGINFTASHNPPEYHGLKFTPAWGGPALPETTGIIEANCQKIEQVKIPIRSIPYEKAQVLKLIKTVDPRPAYLKELKKMIKSSVIRKARLKVGVDLLYGAGRGYLNDALKVAGAAITVLNDRRDVLFGGSAPDPSPERLKELADLVKHSKLDMGVSTDGDADRFGIIDSDGSFVSPNQVLPLLLHHLVKTRKWKGVAVRSVMTSHFVDAVARHYGIDVKETPVGFKYIGQIMTEQEFIIGGEESGGLTVKGHVPEKDGILACLLMAELRAAEKKPFRVIMDDLQKKVGYFYSQRINLLLDENKIERFRERMTANPPVKVDGFKTVRINEMDGWKYIFKENSWMGLRISGTEPVVRLYLEADSRQTLAHLEAAGKKFVKNTL